MHKEIATAPLASIHGPGDSPQDSVVNRRILIIDDNEAIHADIRSVLQRRDEPEELRKLSEALFGADEEKTHQAICYEIDSAFQGREGANLVLAGRDAGRPYAMAFVDMRMPPGWDGIQTIYEIRKIDANIQIIICTAFSDYSWQSILDAFGVNDWLFILKKPFDVVEVQQLACALTQKWSLAQRAALRTDELEEKVREHASKLAAANIRLQEQVDSLAEANTQLAAAMAARQQADDRIRHIAFHDALTDLPNRMLLMERIESCIERSKLRQDYRFALLYCDLDNFKIFNDSLGHRIGDELLVHLAQQLSRALRVICHGLCPAHHTVARLSGDEFVILLDDVPDELHVRDIADQVREFVSEPVRIGTNDLVLSVSVGVALSGGEYDDPIDLLRDADTALYHAKDNGKGRTALFDQQMRAKMTARMDMEHDLRRAVEQKQFVVHYQPIVSLATERVVSLEALVRWLHPIHGLFSPDAFIPIAEETGIIEAIGEIVLEKAIQDVAHWRKTLPGMEELNVNVNLSPRQLVNRKLVNYIDDCLDRFQLSPAALRLEITETAMINNMPQIRAITDALLRRGSEIHLDDFGTGYSSLSVLHTLPFSTIKLDRSFISHLGTELESPLTVQAIMMLAQNRGINVVAEGIETFDQLTHLRALQCDFGQGYYFSRPLPTSEINAYLRRSAAPSSQSTSATPATPPSIELVATQD
jgi:diguanylate cyclase (GGDEF)-like protein